MIIIFGASVRMFAEFFFSVLAAWFVGGRGYWRYVLLSLVG